eukprot:9937786-Alexandrium_andersonii.AAC.1
MRSGEQVPWSGLQVFQDIGVNVFPRGPVQAVYAQGVHHFHHVCNCRVARTRRGSLAHSLSKGAKVASF